MPTLNPRIRIHPDGSATLSGIPAADLKAILTAASIHHYDTEKKHRAKEAVEMARAAVNEHGLGWCIRRNWQESQAWIVRIRAILNLTDQALGRHRYRPAYRGKRIVDLEPWEKEARLRDVRERKKSRLNLERIIAEAIAQRQSEAAI